MKKNVTELIFILDRSGSMAGLESDTIGGFNAMIDQQKKEDGSAYVTTLLFDHEIQFLHDRIDIKHVPKMTTNDYTVRGCTALIDAIGEAIDHISMVHKYIRRSDVPEKTLFVITTDGMENASKKYTSKAVKKMIEKKKHYQKWEFLFIGANIDAVETASHFGIDAERAVNYHPDSKGTQILYQSVNNAVSCMRQAEPLPPTWSQAINDDYNSRNRS